MSRAQFHEFVHAAIVSLPQHVKAMLRLAEDQDIPDEGRTLAAGAILHWLSGSNTIPGVSGGVLAYVDDALMLRLVHERLESIAPDVVTRHRADSPDVFASVVADLALVRGELGDGMGVLSRSLERLPKLKHRGRTAAQCVSDETAGTELYEEVVSALVDLDLDDESVARGLKGLDTLIDGLRAAR
jgi:hypothetical protein